MTNRQHKTTVVKKMNLIIDYGWKPAGDGANFQQCGS